MDNFEQTTFEETQWFAAWVMAIMAGAAVLVVFTVIVTLAHPGKTPFLSLTAGLLFPLLSLGLTANLLCVRTQVTAAELIVTFGVFFPLYRRRIPRNSIISAQAVTYDPIGEYGGWGIRGFTGNQCLNARGNQGVRLMLQNGDKLLIGSQTPERLADALGVLPL